jgi:hypothetical protein
MEPKTRHFILKKGTKMHGPMVFGKQGLMGKILGNKISHQKEA